MTESRLRCAWVGEDGLMVAYHDEEWGVPLHDDRKLFEFLVLEGAQAGLSWMTVLKRREGYREAFDGFDVDKVAKYGSRDVERLLQNEGIIRNRAKIQSTITNARSFRDVQADVGSFDAYIWGFVDGAPIQNRWESVSELPAKTPLSEEISKDLKRLGFRFVGPTIVYAHMQATGMVNDHTTDCFRYEAVQRPTK